MYYNKDFNDYRALSRGRFLDTEVFMRKVRNFSIAANSKLYFPWADKDLIEHIFNLKYNARVNVEKFKNKNSIKGIAL
jgi:hypothetical protein